MATYDAGLFVKVIKEDNKSCHSQEEKHLNIYLNKDTDGSNQPVYINFNGSDCARTPDDKRTCTFHVR